MSPPPPIAIRCTVYFEHITESFDSWYFPPINTLSELTGYFNEYFSRYQEPTRKVKKNSVITPYYSLETVHNDWKLNYDFESLETDSNVHDMFR
jgi:hypothetical protein